MSKQVKIRLVVMLVVAVSLLATVLLVGCSDKKDDDKGGKLATPTNITVNLSEKKLTWNTVSHATKYNVKVNTIGYSPITNSINISDWVVGTTYRITVQAIGDDKWIDSDTASFTYTYEDGSGQSSACEITNAEGFEWNGQMYVTTLSAWVEKFDFKPIITVSANATWQLWSGATGGELIEDSVLTMTNAPATFARVIVKSENGNNEKSYIFRINRPESSL